MTDTFDTAAVAANRRALVLGSGGVAGIAWEIGLLDGLLQRGITLNDADFVVGTSAGSVVGTILQFGKISDAVTEQVMPVEDQPSPSDGFDGTAYMAALAAATEGAQSEQDARARVGVMARSVTEGPPEADRLAMVASQLPSTKWPARRLGITAIDATDGAFHVFDADSGVDLVRAISASCSVPGIWPPTTIDGRPFMDGGMRSATNADVTAGYDRILIVACNAEPPVSALGPTLLQAVDQLQKNGKVLVVTADANSMQAFGTNPLAMSTRAPSAEAGRQQAASISDQIGAFWNDER